MSDADRNPDETGSTRTGESEARTERTAAETGPNVSWGRFARVLVLVAFVSFVFLFTAADALTGVLFQVAVVVIGGVALVTAITGFLIAVASVAS